MKLMVKVMISPVKRPALLGLVSKSICRLPGYFQNDALLWLQYKAHADHKSDPLFIVILFPGLVFVNHFNMLPYLLIFLRIFLVPFLFIVYILFQLFIKKKKWAAVSNDVFLTIFCTGIYLGLYYFLTH